MSDRRQGHWEGVGAEQGLGHPCSDALSVGEAVGEDPAARLRSLRRQCFALKVDFSISEGAAELEAKLAFRNVAPRPPWLRS